MSYKDLIELDDAEMIDLGVASLETEGSGGDYLETGTGTEPSSDSPPAH